MEEIATNIDPENIVYSDETGIDDNEVPTSGWSPKGKRCYAEKKAERTLRLNITAALHRGRLFAPFIFEGYSNSQVYEIYIKRVLVPNLRPGMVVVIDNASFHKSPRITQLIEAAGCQVMFLPPYSPDLNPIENCWSSVKRAIRRAAEVCTNFYDAAVSTLHKMCIA